MQGTEGTHMGSGTGKAFCLFPGKQSYTICLWEGLGKLFNSSVKDTEPIKAEGQELEKHLTNRPHGQIQVLDLSACKLPVNPVASLALQCLRVHKREPWVENWVVTLGRASWSSSLAVHPDLCSSRRRTGCRLVQQEVTAGMEEERATRAVMIQHQGAGTSRWTRSWSDLWQAKP